MSEAAAVEAPAAEAVAEVPSTPEAPISEASDLELLDGGGAEAGAEPERFVVKVDGQDVELTLDELKSGYGLEKASRARFDEAAQIRSEAQTFLEARDQLAAIFQGDDLGSQAELLRRLSGGRYDQLLNHMAQDALNWEEMSDDARRATTAEKELESYRRKEAEVKQGQEAESLRVEQAKEVESYKRKFTEAMTAAGMKPTPMAFQQIASAVQASMQAGKDIPLEEIVGLANREFWTDAEARIGDLEGDALLGALPKSLIKRVVAAEVSRLKASRQPIPATSRSPERHGGPDSKVKRLTLKEAMEISRKRR